MNNTTETQKVIEALNAYGISLPDGPIRLGRYGDSEASECELLNLIKAGVKRGGASLLWEYEAEGEAIPKPGDIEIIVNAEHQPEIVSSIINVNVVPFGEVSSDHAALEGEGDKSLEFWRQVHWEYFANVCYKIGRLPSKQMPVVCEEFKVIHVVDLSVAT